MARVNLALSAKLGNGFDNPASAGLDVTAKPRGPER
jgi:hypothetical protein